MSGAGDEETKPPLIPSTGPANTQTAQIQVAGPAEIQPVPVAGPAETQPVPGLMTGNKQSTPYMKLFFAVISPHGHPITMERDCDLNCRIQGLKNECAEQIHRHSVFAVASNTPGGFTSKDSYWYP